MKKILLTLLGVIVVLGLVAATGYAGYRVGYAQGAQQTTGGQLPELRPFDERGPDRMPMPVWGNRLDRGFDRGLRPDGFLMRGFGFFALLRFIGPLFMLALVALFIFWLFTRSGWQLTRTIQTTQTQSPPAATEAKETEQES